MDRTIAAWENEGGAPQAIERKVARKFASHSTFLLGVLYVITIILVLMIVSKL
jgi:preprotein translocase subunit SecG